MGSLYEDLKEGFQEILAYRKGKITLCSERIEIPEPPMEYKAKDIKRIREKGDYSQSIFAAILNVSIRTVQSWESGVRVPNHSALRLLEIIDKGFYPPSSQKHLRSCNLTTL
ncbi:MAG: helix-turn-helix domain-containing protein [Rhabdochlamydiaceae bacterium]|jgi:putative transcriptional regulator